MHDDVKGFFAKAVETDLKDIQHYFYTENDAGNGRIETRSCWVLDPFLYKNCFSNLEKWDKLKRVIMVKSRREFKDKITEDTRLYITSCALGAQDLLNAVRKHWQIENPLQKIMP